MDHPKMIAIGIGCRSGTRKEVIILLIRDTLARESLPVHGATLFTYEGKKNEAGLVAAAEALTLPLRFLSLEALRAVADKITIRSEAAQNALGLPSVAEAAALAGAGEGARLLVPRIKGEGATCAIAEGDG
ncbi:MAG TPA: cobalamin biosynthesis protein [Methylovirgula sp.]|jgi:cobalt-precorrin 5A hydrolase